ncbi:hypothetical protein BATDEDRAFT_36502 [Batrachochytrium dendrobatidis JAM81]|uniref:Cytochrome b561 domain-containing protein n=3 Tax=Batrachochytrium dendrobatidis TaxID=109871 RepID=F4NSG0_BATDJ|nr:uncharacterized protein BATDEDRAFT_36502 [Batrachochytrium dendrobatidis JAM81]EGF83427.1 hypothetical protein BATDEDRAFT_36502 [Batrachochytrium dendrobatidis JAM81]KAK5668270.1 hypothetical protein QVD99_005306 [Batrachochytrium dendrobatidis]|eukprot:XP_006675886.1 hypothetical protein BATDEDRAFT_36502 [Batrachochytrium dendrobatidis JAM81]
MCNDNLFCVTGTKDTRDNIMITVHSSALGWVGFGIGSGMADSSIYLGWKNTTGGVILSSRQSSGYAVPRVSTENIVTLVATPANIIAPSWARITFTFVRPAVSSIKSITSGSTYIYAMSDVPPANLDSPETTIRIHNRRGVIRGLDLTTEFGSNNTSAIPTGHTDQPVLQLPNGVSYDYILRVHGIMMVVAWSISPAIGIFVARYLKITLGAKWFHLHIFFMFVVTGILTIASIVVVYIYKTSAHFSSYHEVIGLTVGVGMLVQFFLGFLSNATFNPKRSRIPLQDRVHWWFGRILALLAIVNVFFGMNLYDSLGFPISVGYKIGFGILIAVIVICFIAAQCLIGQKHHDESTDTLFHS